MCKLFLTRFFVAAAVVFGFSSAYAVEKIITVDAVFEKDVFAVSAFGSSLNSLPLNITMVVEDTDSGIVEVAAGDQVRSDGAVMVAGATLIPQSAIVSLEATLGDSTWTESDLVTRNLFDSGLSSALLLEGGLDNSNNIALGISLFVSSASGEFLLGHILCPSLDCVVPLTGNAIDPLGNFGTVTSVVVNVEDVELTPSEQIAELQKDVEILGISDALLEAVEAKLEAQSGNNNAAVNMLEAFINSIDARRGTVLTDVQADDLITRAQAIIDALEVMGSE